MPDDGTRTEGGRVLSLNSLATFACRIERDDSRLYLVETPVHGDERQYLGTAELDISGVKIEIGLTAMAMDALGKRSSP
jgi:hypothetical protein